MKKGIIWAVVGLFVVILLTYASPATITITSPKNESISDNTPDLNLTIDETVNLTYAWDAGGNISGCRNCSSYNTTYGEYANSSEGNLTALWHFNENSGNVLFDSSANGNNGTINATWVPGIFGNALDFYCGVNALGYPCENETADSSIEVPPSDSLNITDSITLIAWIKPRSFSGWWDTIVEKYNDRYAMYTYQGYVDFYIQGLTNQEVRGVTKASIGSWHCIAGTYDGSEMKVYLDGQKDGNISASGSISTSSGHLGIGGKGGDNSFNGTIDELAIFDRALSETEIAEFCNKTMGDGPHYVTVYAINETGAMSSSVQSFTVDTTEPYQIGLNYPSNDSINSTSINFNWTSYDVTSNTSSNLTIDGVVNRSGINTNQGTPTNVTVLVPEGIHSWSVTTWDAADNTNTSETIYFTIDLTSPQYVTFNNTPLSPYDNESVTCYSYWNDNYALAFAVVEVIAPGFTHNETVNLTNTSGWGNYTISAADLEAGSVQCRVYANDSAGNLNVTASGNFTVFDTSAPLISEISYVPNTTVALDPNVTINVSANIIDYTGVDTVLLEYSNDSVNWNSTNMSNVSGAYRANFTPQIAGNWSFRIRANDTLGNVNTSDNTTVDVAFEWGWTSSPTSFGVKSGIVGENISVGSLTITSESDLNLSFDLSSNLWIYFDTSAGSTSYDVNAEESRIIAVNASLPATEAEYSVTISISAANESAVPALRTANVTLIAYQSGPYLYVTIDTYPLSVTQGDANVNLQATVTNYGNASATNCTMLWGLPSGWTNSSGDLNFSIPSLGVISKNTRRSNITVDIGSSAPTGTQTLTMDVVCAEKTGSRSVGVYVNAKSSPSTTGGDGGGILSEKVIERTLPTEYSPTPEQRGEILNVGVKDTTFEVVRGRESYFDVSVTNPFENSTIENLDLKVGGSFAQYLKVEDLGKTGAHGEIKIELASEPGEAGLGYGETQTYAIIVDTPTYLDKGTYPTNLTVTGNVSYVNYPAVLSGRTGEVLEYKNITYEMAESRTVALDVHIISRDEGEAAIEDGATYIGYMQNAGFSTRRVDKLIEAANAAMAAGNYDTAREISEEISRIKEAAFSARDAISVLGNLIRDAEEGRGLKVLETEKLLNLAVAAFEREDYETALQRVNDANLVYSSETRGKVNYAKMVLDNLAALTVGAVILFAFAIVAFKRASVIIINRRLGALDVREANVMALMREAQDSYYFKETLSPSIYKKEMETYTNRLNEIKSNRAKLKTRRAAAIGPTGQLENLREERQNLEELIRDTQEGYYNRKTMSREEYDESMEYYVARQVEVEEAIAVLEMKVSK